jgi:hypothetical protein
MKLNAPNLIAACARFYWASAIFALMLLTGCANVGVGFGISIPIGGMGSVGVSVGSDGRLGGSVGVGVGGASVNVGGTVPLPVVPITDEEIKKP